MSNRLLLLLEDNSDDALLVAHALKKKHVQCDLAVVRSSAEAFAYLLGTGDYERGDTRVAPSLILLDLELPQLNVQAIHRLRADERTKHLPVVVFSSSDEDRYVADAYLAGASSYLHKPLLFDDFCEVIELVNRYWLNFNMPPPPPRGSSFPHR